MKIWLTGGAGWLGSRLVEMLQEHGHELRCFVLPGQTAVDTTVGDLRNPDDCRRFLSDAAGGTVIHVAGLIHPRLRVRELYEVNVDGTRNLLEAARAAGVARVVVLSSNSPCGCNPHPEHRFTEDSPYHPYMSYGRSKMKMEMAVRESSGFEWVLIRAPWFYGPNQPERQTTFFKMIRDGGFPQVGPGDNMRSMAYLDNLCQGLELAATSARAAGQIYWIADARPYPMKEVVGMVAELLIELGFTVRPGRLRLPWAAGEVATWADAFIQKLGFYQQKIHVLSELNKNIACSVDKARAELGYAPAIDLREGMRRSIVWCTERGYLS